MQINSTNGNAGRRRPPANFQATFKKMKISALQLRSFRKKSQLISKNVFNHQMQINQPTVMR